MKESKGVDNMDSQTKDAISSFIVILTSASISNNILDGLLSGMGVWHLLVICFSIILYLNNQQYSRFTNLCTAFGAFVGLRLTAITVVDGWYSGNQTAVLDSIDAGWITYTSAPVAGICAFLLLKLIFSKSKISEEEE